MASAHGARSELARSFIPRQQTRDWLRKITGKANCSKISLSPGSAPFRRSLGKNTAAYIAYAMRTGPVGLMVIPDSVAHASGESFPICRTWVSTTAWCRATRLLLGRFMDWLMVWSLVKEIKRSNPAWSVIPQWRAAISVTRRLLCTIEEILFSRSGNNSPS